MSSSSNINKVSFPEERRLSEEVLAQMTSVLSEWFATNRISQQSLNAKVAGPYLKRKKTLVEGEPVSFKEVGNRSVLLFVRVANLKGDGEANECVVSLTTPQKAQREAFLKNFVRFKSEDEEDPSPEPGQNSLGDVLSTAEAYGALKGQVRAIDMALSSFLKENPESLLDIGRVQTILREKFLFRCSQFIAAAQLREILAWLNGFNPGKWIGRQMNLEGKARLEFAPEEVEENDLPAPSPTIVEKSTPHVSRSPGNLDEYFESLPALVKAYGAMIRYEERELEALRLKTASERKVAKALLSVTNLKYRLREHSIRLGMLTEIRTEFS